METIVHYLAKYSQAAIERRLAWLSPNCPLTELSHPAEAVPVQTVRQAAIAD